MWGRRAADFRSGVTAGVIEVEVGVDYDIDVFRTDACFLQRVLERITFGDGRSRFLLGVELCAIAGFDQDGFVRGTD